MWGSEAGEGGGSGEEEIKSPKLWSYCLEIAAFFFFFLVSTCGDDIEEVVGDCWEDVSSDGGPGQHAFQMAQVGWKWK